MICENCGKEGAEVRLSTKGYGKGDNLIVIEDVPIIHCRNCGQSYLTAQTTHKIEEILHNRQLPSQKLKLH